MGDAVAWFEASATSVAVITALGWQVFDHWKSRANEVREQAALVTGWEIDIVPKQKPYPMIRLGVSNGSKQAIYEVRLKLAVGVRGTFIRMLGSLGPSEAREVRIPLPGYPRSSMNTPDLMFKDARGVEWVRTARGELRKATGNDQLSFWKADPGSYQSVAEHPTLNLPLWEDEYAVYRDRPIKDSTSTE